MVIKLIAQKKKEREEKKESLPKETISDNSLIILFDDFIYICCKIQVNF
jgi:hypothetical protein